MPATYIDNFNMLAILEYPEIVLKVFKHFCSSIKTLYTLNVVNPYRLVSQSGGFVDELDLKEVAAKSMELEAIDKVRLKKHLNPKKQSILDHDIINIRQTIIHI